MLVNTNEGAADRALRILLGIALLALTLTGPRTAWGWIGLLPLVTGIVGWCPAYAVLGLSTQGRRGRHHPA